MTILVFLVLAFAANFLSCFSTVPSTPESTITPRSPDLTNPAELRLVQRLGAAWVSGGGSSDLISAWLLDDDSINAASFGTGVFVLWRGLASLEDEALDVIVAHEIAHDQLLHSRKVSDLNDVTNFVGEILGTISHSGEGGTETIKKWSGAFVVPRYSRQHELEADAKAVSLLMGLGYSDAGAVVCEAFGHLRSTAGEAGGGFFDDHPALTERMHAILERYPSAAATRDCR